MEKRYQVDTSRVWFKPESGWPEAVPKNLDFPAITLSQMFEQSVRQYGNRKIGWFLGSTMTYAEMGRHVDALATALHQHGFRKGDVLTLLLPNSFQYIMCYFAAAKIGVVVSGINPTYKAGEILHQLKTVNAKGLVVLDALFEKSVEPILAQSGVEFLVHTNVADFLPKVKQVLGKLLKKIPVGKVPAHSVPLMELLGTKANVPSVALDVEEMRQPTS